MKEKVVDLLKVEIYRTPVEMGIGAAKAIAADIKRIASEKNNVRMMFAAAPSQDTTLCALMDIPDIPWEVVTAFHMDEYVGISEDRKQSFRNYLKRNIFSRKPFGDVNYIRGEVDDVEAEIQRYGKLLSEAPIDIIILGIGENGHIAFNDPGDADFDDPQPIRQIVLSEMSRTQQVHDGCFDTIEEVPTLALTVTIPQFMEAQYLHCIVPNARKAQAVHDTIYGPVSNRCPASVLRKHPHSVLYLDEDSASQL